MSATQIKAGGSTFKPKAAKTSFKAPRKAEFSGPVNPATHSTSMGANSHMVTFTRRDGTKVSFKRTQR